MQTNWIAEVGLIILRHYGFAEAIVQVSGEHVPLYDSEVGLCQ